MSAVQTENLETHKKTIFAPATGHGLGAISIVRISGPHTAHVLNCMLDRPTRPRFASLRTIRHPDDDSVIDKALVLFFPGPNSFTGEDSAEFHLHGGIAVTRSCLGALSAIANTRLAEPGEFTFRAYQNGKLNLLQAEGLADLIDSRTERQKQQALRFLEGDLGVKVQEWRIAILNALVVLEAEIDFSDEDDVPDFVSQQVTSLLDPVTKDLQNVLQHRHSGEQIRDGYKVVLAGPPNAGKSTLLNALAKRDVAIVSAVPGTTRDTIEVNLDLAGYPVVVTDTAGLRETSDIVEAEGIRRTRLKGRQADLILWLTDAGEYIEPDVSFTAARWIIRTKADLYPQVKVDSGQFLLSLNDPNDIQKLVERLTDHISSNDQDDSIYIARERHVANLSLAFEHLTSVKRNQHQQIEFMAEDCRLALLALEKLIGTVTPDEILGSIFSTFCIGK